MVPSSALAPKWVTLASRLAPTTNLLPCPNTSSELVACTENPPVVEFVLVRSFSPRNEPSGKVFASCAPFRPLAGVLPSPKQRNPSLGGSQTCVPVGLPSWVFWLNERTWAAVSTVQLGVTSTLPVRFA